MFCTSCGHQIRDGLKFCTSCGQPLSNISTQKTETPTQYPLQTPVIMHPEPPMSFRKKIALGSVLLLGLISFAGYYFFLKHDPQKDGVKSAMAYCSCMDDNAALENTRYKQFIDSFPAYSFKSRLEAREKLGEVQTKINQELTNCFQEADIKMNNLEKRYTLKPAEASVFLSSFEGIHSSCTSSDGIAMSPYYDEAEAKIMTLPMPGPELDQIKNDLLGKRIPGFQISYLSDMETVEVIHQTESNNRLESLVKLVLRSRNQNATYETEVMMVYNTAGDNWQFESIDMPNLFYINTIPSNEWISIYMLQKCRLKIDNAYKLSWRLPEYNTEINTGPDIPDAYLPYSLSYNIKSREDQAVRIKFSYIPVSGQIPAVQLGEDGNISYDEAAQNNYSNRSSERGYVQTEQGSDLRLRANPSENATIVAGIPNGSQVNILGQSETTTLANGDYGKWFNVSYNGKKGWVWGKFIVKN